MPSGDRVLLLALQDSPPSPEAIFGPNSTGQPLSGPQPPPPNFFLGKVVEEVGMLSCPRALGERIL